MTPPLIPEARSLEPGEAEPFLEVLCAAFGLDIGAARPLYYRDPFFDLHDKRVLCAPSGEIVSCCTVIPSALSVGQAMVPVSGITGVATVPHCRQLGYATSLLAGVLHALSVGREFPLSALFPASPAFYQRLGFETASRAQMWTGRPSDLPAFEGACDVRMAGADSAADWEAVRAIHAAATAGKTGACLRDDRRWQVIAQMSPTRETFVYQRTGAPIEGYLMFERATGPECGAVTVHVHEMHAVSPPAARALTGFLARFPLPATSIHCAASPADRLAFAFPDQPQDPRSAAQAAPVPRMMLRLIDLPAALSAIYEPLLAPAFAAAAGPGALTIRATDPLLPQNERPVRVSPAGIHAGDIGDLDWIAADIRVLAQVYTGYWTPSEAHSRGVLTASSPDSLALADALFPSRFPHVAATDQF